MYLTSYDELQRALEQRRKRSEEIRESANAFAQHRYGIENMLGIVEQSFGFMHKDRSYAFLARQIASVCAEDIAFETGARLMGVEPATVSFVRDAFTRSNHDKLHRVRMPWISWSKKGNLVLAHERICARTNDELEATPLDRIICANGVTLPAYHEDLRTRVGMRGLLSDVSAVQQELLSAARYRPGYLFREVCGKEHKHVLVPGEEIQERDRPPASWYYPLYLSWFLDGSLVLFETYDNPMGDVVHAKSLFERTMQDVTNGTGFAPLIVKIPPLSKEMLYCNRHFLDEKGGINAVAREAAGVPKNDTVALFQAIAESIIRFR